MVSKIADRLVTLRQPNKGGHAASEGSNRFIEEVLDNQDLALVDELLAPDYINHLAPGGREGFKQFNTMLRSALPDLKLHISMEHLIAEGDYVVARITFNAASRPLSAP